MSVDLPLWFGRERGTDLSALADWDEDVDGETGGWFDEFAAGLLGLLAPVALIALLIGSAQLPLAAMVGLVLLGGAWLASGVLAAWLVHSSEDEAPLWASVFVHVIVILGKIIAFASIIIAALVLLAMLLMIIVGAASDRR